MEPVWNWYGTNMEPVLLLLPAILLPASNDTIRRLRPFILDPELWCVHLYSAMIMDLERHAGTLSVWTPRL